MLGEILRFHYGTGFRLSRWIRWDIFSNGIRLRRLCETPTSVIGSLYRSVFFRRTLLSNGFGTTGVTSRSPSASTRLFGTGLRLTDDFRRGDIGNLCQLIIIQVVREDSGEYLPLYGRGTTWKILRETIPESNKGTVREQGRILSSSEGDLSNA